MKAIYSTLLAVILAISATAFGQSAKKLVCPVTRLTIPSVKATVAKSVYKGKTYYFCTSNCKHLFDKNPAKYAGR